MNNKYRYKICHLKDSEYEIVEMETEDCVFQWSLEEINAWISLKEKGFDL